MVAFAVSATVLAGCAEDGPEGGENGVGKLSPESIRAKAEKAASGASSVRLAGTLVSNGQPVKLDMRLSAAGGIGEVSTGGMTFSLLRAEEDLFLKAGDEFWLHQDDGEDSDGKPSESDMAAARKLDGKYVKVPPEDTAYKQLSGFTEMKVLLDGLLKLDGELAAENNGEVDGFTTIRVTADEGAGGALEVALEGRPYPLLLERAGDAGELRLLNWDEEFEVNAPRKEEVVDYGKQISAS
ncbi:hypothetical protein OG946_25570 [Streptomyces sp. NBC_01808]|uniref:hypothetical protein n=1 Tax=Streptomyces sp. NBC_01808 TaxID=2975947 RepID=UPI002DD7E497|nr:hypothetical protein [Streptomyces sp. NBC_01808]WSA42595.1 hypothetical protein OG946_25570 [Streptomyces sp. NBC_01808]